MQWFKDNKFKILKWSGLGAACLVVLLLAFAGARYLASASEYEGTLEQLVPADAALVLHVPDVPAARRTSEAFLDDLLERPEFAWLESSPLWRDRLGKAVDGSLQTFRDETMKQGLERALRQSESMGVRLFDDVLGGELLLAAGAGPDGGFVALSRVSRPVRLRWQFIDVASGFFPSGPEAPQMEYSGGVLRVTPRAKPGEPAPATLSVTLLDDVLVIAGNERMLNAVLAAHEGGKSLATAQSFVAARKLPTAEDAARFAATLWLDLDRMRAFAKKDKDGRSSVDEYTSLPVSVVSIYPDIMAPLNTMLARNLDTTVFDTAYYGIDLESPGTLRFDQYLLVAQQRAAHEGYKHLRDTWAQPAARADQLRLLPPDTMFTISYRQPLKVLYGQVLDERGRSSLVGDFIVAMQGPMVEKQMGKPIEEVMFAAAPRRYAPTASVPLSGTDMPLPAFVIGFRAPDAREEIAGALLNEYLQAQRGRSTRTGEAPRPGVVQVVEQSLEGRRVWAFHDPREGDSFVQRLNNSMRAALVGQWLLLTNSERLLARALRSSQGTEPGLDNATDSPFALLDATTSATMYLNWDVFADFTGSDELLKVLRDTKFNRDLIEGRDPRELREEIAREFGLDATDVASLSDTRVAAEFERRKQAWHDTCDIQGTRYVNELRANFSGVRFFRDLAMTTRFGAEYLHVKGLLRVG